MSVMVVKSNKRDLSDTNGTYAKVLIEKRSEINEAYSMPGATTETFKAAIIDLIHEASDTDAKRNFIVMLNKQRSKDKILEFVYAAIMRGCGLGANVNDNFNTTKRSRV